MKKKFFIITAVSAFMTLSAAASVGLTNEVVHTHAEDGKTIVEIDVKDETAIGESTVAFNCEGDLPDGLVNHDFTWYVNNEQKTSVARRNNTNSLSFGFVGNYYGTYDEADYYRHYQIKKGTVLFTSDTTNYVLKNDYNFWFTRGQNSGGSWLFQHGGTNHYGSSTGLTNDNINSLKFKSLGGGIQDFAHRFIMQPTYEETSDPWTYASLGWQQRCPVFIDKGTGYVLSDTSSPSTIIWENGQVDNNNETLLFSLYYSEVFGGGDTFENIDMDRSYYSFYIPNGTLWGGLDRPFMIEGDYYFEIVKDASKGYWHGFFNTPHEYVKNEAVASTCLKEGNKEYYTCSRNTHSNETEEYFVKNADGTYSYATKDDFTLPLADHTYHQHNAVASTCYTEGNKEYYTCDVCNKYFFKNADGTYTETNLDATKIPASHTYVFDAEVAATETTHGTKAHYKCSACNKIFFKNSDGTYTETTAADIVTHNLVDVAAVEETCTEDGNKAYKKCTCTDCGKLYVENESGKLVETTLEDVTIKKHDHTLEDKNAVAATCTEDGHTADKVCSECGQTIVEGTTISALGHIYGEWTLDETTMKISHTCETCQDVETVDVSVENGFTYTVTKESTTTEQGEATWTKEGYGTFTVKLPLKEKTNNAGLIVGISVGAGVVVIGAGVGLFFFLKKKRA